MHVARTAARVFACAALAASSVFAKMQPADAPLLTAVASSDVAAAQRAIAAGANVNFADGGVTPLIVAVTMNNAAMVDALLAAGADPEVKDETGRTPADVARTMNLAGLLPKLEAAAKPAAPATPPPVAAAPTPTPAPAPTPTTPPPVAAAAGETGTFDDVEFKIPDPKKWKDKVVNGNLVFSSPLPPPDFCTITVYASRDLKGDATAVANTLDAVVQASLKETKTKKVEKDSGPKVMPSTNPNLAVTQRVLYCETEDYHVAHYFIALHGRDRLQVIAYQSSGMEMFQANQADAEAFLKSVNVVTSKPLAP